MHFNRIEMNNTKLTLYSVLLILFSLIVNSCSNPKDVVFKVEVTSPAKNVLYLTKLGYNTSQILDSVKIKSGTSVKKFGVTQDDEPTFYSIGFKKGGAITLLAKKGETIEIECNTENLLDYKVKGSEGSDKVQYITKLYLASEKKLKEISNSYLKANADTERNQLNKEFETELDSLRGRISRFIWKNPMSKASAMGLYLKYNDFFIFDREEDLTLIKMVASAWRAMYPKSDYTKGMLADIKRIENRIASIKIQQLVKSSEMSIPDLDIPNKKGNSVKLSSLKGKVVLLDFFATTNTNSLLDNRELLNIYKDFHGKGFEVYQVSLDTNKDEWLTYIENTNIPWIMVREDKPSTSIAAMTYNVQQLPANYLINQKQEIIGKNLYGDDLKNAIKEALSK